MGTKHGVGPTCTGQHRLNLRFQQRAKPAAASAQAPPFMHWRYTLECYALRQFAIYTVNKTPRYAYL